MKKIMIIGCCGSGKTTLSKELALKLKLPLVHLDKLYWRENWESISKNDFKNLIMNEVIKSKWIIDGNYNSTITLRLKYCDTVIYLDYSRLTSLCGVLKRVITMYGKSRDDMGENCPERFDFDFLKFVWKFNENNRKNYYNILEKEKDKKVIILKNRKETKRFLEKLIVEGEVK